MTHIISISEMRKRFGEIEAMLPYVDYIPDVIKIAER